MGMQPWRYPIAGSLDEHWLDSQALTGNPLGDPHRRPLLVQTPPGYDDEPERRYATIYVLQGLGGLVVQWRNRRSADPNLPEQLDALFAAGEAPPAIIVYVDAWTRLGGSQFIDSPGTGRYHTYLCDELVPFVDAHYRTAADPAHRAVTGHSSGGYGAVVNAMLRPDLFGGIASHAGDGLFDISFGPLIAGAFRALRDGYGGSVDAFWTDVESRPGRTKAGDDDLKNIYCMAACFSADANGSVRLPFDEVGGIVPDVWDRWLAHDPVRMAPRYPDALRSMRAIWLDAGRSDEFTLDLATDALRRELERLGIGYPVLRVELYEGGHSGSGWRYPLAIRWLAERLSP